MKVVIAGGTGALGRRLSADLCARGHEVVVLSRTPGPAPVPGTTPPVRRVVWDGRTVGAWAGELAGAVVVNLAGELVDRRPSPASTALLRDSRVLPTRALVRAAAALDAPVPVWVQASTLAIHGDAGEALLTESSPAADRPPQMAGVARAWEEAAVGANAERRVVLRTSVVLDRGTPALDRLVSLVRAGAGGRVGSGRQWVSWIHVADWLAVVRLLLGEADDPAPSARWAGVVVVTAPQPVRNAELMAALRAVLRRPLGLPAPVPLVHLGALALRTDPALALTGRRAVPERLTAAGFGFAHPQLRGALADLLG